MPVGRHRNFPALGLLLCCLAAAAGERRRVTPEDVQQAIEKGRAALLGSVEGALRDRLGGQGFGLTLLALLGSGIKPDDPRISRAIADWVGGWKELMAQQYHGTYQGGILLMLLAQVDDPRYRPVAAEIARKLQRFQELGGGWGDYSRTQFALLGLKAAEDLGVDVPDSVFESALRYVVSGQNPDGGWAYTPGAQQSYGSMTVAGITSLHICRSHLSRSSKTCGQQGRDKNMEAGLAWLAANFTVRSNPGKGNTYPLYYLYGLERVGVILARRYLGGYDWYREGAEFLVNAQSLRDGTWRQDLYGTQYALLFLGKASRPLALQKLDYGPGWDSDPFDVKDLTERASKDLKQPMTYQIVDQETRAEELLAAPLLYLQGHGRVTFKPGFQAQLRRYLDHGGFLFASACCGSTEFDQSFREEMKKMYPGVAFETLPASHPLYRSPNRIEGTAFMLEAMNTGCRYSVYYAPHDVCCGWGGCLGCRDTQTVPAETSRRLGVNLLAHVIGLRPLKDRLEDVQLEDAERARRMSPDALQIGRVHHDGGSQLDPGAIPNLLQTLREETHMQRDATTVEVAPASDELGDFPILYLIGYRDFTLTDREVRQLRAYLDRGGFLFAECGCGRDEFDQAFRRFIARLYPDAELKRLPPDHPVLHATYDIDQVKYKPSVTARYPDLGTQPHLEGIHFNDRLSVVYSRFNLSCELQGRVDPTSLGVLNPDAYKIGVNVIVYALSH